MLQAPDGDVMFVVETGKHRDVKLPKLSNTSSKQQIPTVLEVHRYGGFQKWRYPKIDG